MIILNEKEILCTTDFKDSLSLNEIELIGLGSPKVIISVKFRAVLQRLG